METSVANIIGGLVGGNPDPEYKMLENVTVTGVRKVAKPSFLDSLFGTINKISAVKLPAMTQEVKLSKETMMLIGGVVLAFLFFNKRRR